MSMSSSARKPLGVRVTLDEHKVIAAAARREHRSINSFVVQAALKAANAAEGSRPRTEETVHAAIDRAQTLMRRHRTPGQSLVDQLIAERRAEAARE